VLDNLLARSTVYACGITNAFASMEIDWVLGIMSIEAQLIGRETHLGNSILRHDTTAPLGSVFEIDRNLLNFGVKLGTSPSRSSSEDVKEEIH